MPDDITPLVERLIGMEVMLASLSTEVRHSNKSIEEVNRRMDGFLSIIAALQTTVTNLQIKVGELESDRKGRDFVTKSVSGRDRVFFTVSAAILGSVIGAAASVATALWLKQ